MLRRLLASGLLWPTLMTVVALPILLGLGTWQLQRKIWKDGLQRQIDLRRDAAPVPMAEALAAAGGRLEASNEYLRVRLAGTFDHASERYLYWPLPEGQGWHVFTVFRPDDGTSPVFVNRGWVPDALKAPDKRRQGQIDGPTTVTGLLRAPEAPGRFTPPNEPNKNIWFWRDLQGMAQGLAGSVLATASVDVEATPPNPGGWPRGGVTNVKLSNRHLEYAFKWYALAATLVGVYLVFARGRLAGARHRIGVNDK